MIEPHADRPVVHLVSFWRGRRLNEAWKIPCYSVAYYQPDGFEFTELDLLKPQRTDGKWLPERSDTFKRDYEALLKSQAKEVTDWVESIDQDIGICCYCQDQQYFVTRCTRILIGGLLRRTRSDITVKTDLRNLAWKVI